MHTHKSLILQVQNSSYRALGKYVLIPVVVTLLVFLTVILAAPESYRWILGIPSGVVLFLALYLLFSYLKGFFKDKYLKFSRRGLTDNFSPFGLGKVPAADLSGLRIKRKWGQNFIQMNISPHSYCFQDLDEPHGILMNLYNFFFSGRVYWPLSLFDIEILELETYFESYNKYCKTFNKSLHFTPQTKKTKPPKPTLKKEQLLPIKPATAVTSIAELNEQANLIQDFCDIYMGNLRYLAEPQESHEITQWLEIKSIEIHQKDNHTESIHFKYNQKEWEASLAPANSVDQFYLSLHINGELVFKVSVLQEIGSLEPIEALFEAPGPWKTETLNLFKILQENSYFR